MAKLVTIGRSITSIDTRAAKPAEKRADLVLLSERHRAFRDEVMRRAGDQCQHIDGGYRCEKTSPPHRLFADHIVEREDGGALFDPANGQALCGSHHTLKTVAARARRVGGRKSLEP